ncbi:MAG: UDP-3-O-acylglucosamine N-acyltransferase [Fimbriimonadaceae bacterium]|nr:UDP-3-O-acylglucosamine N-acyltransferase [Fimbriimonadaceae bacterium]
MATHVSGWTLAQLAQLLGGTVVGDETVRISRPVPAGFDDPDGITFAESDKYLDLIRASRVGAAIVKADVSLDIPRIVHHSPRTAFGMLLALARRDPPVTGGIHPNAVVCTGATVDPSASIGAFAYVEAGATIGARSRVYPFAFIGEDCVLGEDVTVYPHAVLVQSVKVGDGTIIHPGAILGADGFGFHWDGHRRQKVPQVGGLRLGDDVEIGANTCIDRATCGDSVIEQGVKIDNLVQIGHNGHVKEHTVIAGHSGISGSVTIGRRTVVGGQVAIADHVEIADDVMLAGRSGVMSNLDRSGEYFGTPPVPVREGLRALALQRRLPELFERLKELEAEVSAWRDRSNSND